MICVASKNFFLILLICGLGFFVQSDSHASTQVMIFGTFHFASPGLDTAKHDVIDVSTKGNQRYLQKFSKKIATSFSPTHVLAECARRKSRGSRPIRKNKHSSSVMCAY